jgi:hypothetical protein
LAETRRYAAGLQRPVCRREAPLLAERQGSACPGPDRVGKFHLSALACGMGFVSPGPSRDFGPAASVAVPWWRSIHWAPNARSAVGCFSWSPAWSTGEVLRDPSVGLGGQRQGFDVAPFVDATGPRRHRGAFLAGRLAAALVSLRQGGPKRTVCGCERWSDRPVGSVQVKSDASEAVVRVGPSGGWPRAGGRWWCR